MPTIRNNACSRSTHTHALLHMVGKLGALNPILLLNIIVFCLDVLGLFLNVIFLHNVTHFNAISDTYCLMIIHRKTYNSCLLIMPFWNEMNYFILNIQAIYFSISCSAWALQSHIWYSIIVLLQVNKCFTTLALLVHNFILVFSFHYVCFTKLYSVKNYIFISGTFMSMLTIC